ncbi:hypothetical protein BDW60DRAFT_132885 [Aspergillus nidulans var. acristatus]
MHRPGADQRMIGISAPEPDHRPRVRHRRKLSSDLFFFAIGCHWLLSLAFQRKLRLSASFAPMMHATAHLDPPRHFTRPEVESIRTVQRAAPGLWSLGRHLRDQTSSRP